ncbi:hypothetical protein CsSME_00031808 [Camellia sinensis var. sinensis]
MVEAMQRRASEGSSMKSFNSIILKFPKIDESLRKCKAIFEQFASDAFHHHLMKYLNFGLSLCLFFLTYALFFFNEMDWDINGMVNFKEFLFAFTCWVAIDDIEDDKEGKENV